MKYSTVYKLQRFSATLLLPLMAWFVYVIVDVFRDNSLMFLVGLKGWKTLWLMQLNSALKASIAICFVTLFLIHGQIGIKSVVDDYIKCPVAKKLICLVLYSITFFSIVAFMMTLFFGIFK